MNLAWIFGASKSGILLTDIPIQMEMSLISHDQLVNKLIFISCSFLKPFLVVFESLVVVKIALIEPCKDKCASLFECAAESSVRWQVLENAFEWMWLGSFQCYTLHLQYFFMCAY